MKKAGKCINFGLCGLADTREVISIEDLMECPECQKPLQPAAAKTGNRVPLRIPGGGRVLAIAAVAVCVVTVGLWWTFRASPGGPEEADQVISVYYPGFRK